MNKEYLEALDRLYCSGNLQLDYVLSNQHKQDYELLKHVFQHIESIDNAEPSEAMECLECLYSNPDDYRNNDRTKDYNTIKNYILKTQELQNGGRLPDKEILSLKQGIEKCKDKPILYISRTYGNKYIVPQNLLDDLSKENELLKEIIKSFFDRGCPLHQYTDKDGMLLIEVDNECSTMHLGKFKDTDLDAKLKEVLENE